MPSPLSSPLLISFTVFAFLSLYLTLFPLHSILSHPILIPILSPFTSPPPQQQHQKQTPSPSLLPRISTLNSPSLKWTLSNAPLNISVPGRVPSHAHLDLFAAGIIPDPYVGLNEFELRWVVDQNWRYVSESLALGLCGNAELDRRGQVVLLNSSTTFNSSKSTSDSSLTSALHGSLASRRSPSLETYIIFSGLDTFASVSFCGTYLGSTANQFLPYIFRLTSILESCPLSQQILNVTFESAATRAKAIHDNPSSQHWPDGIQIPFEFPYREYVRKQGSDFGWDWGPAFVPAGIWKDVHLVQIPSGGVHVTNAKFDLYKAGQRNNLPPDQTRNWIFEARLDVLGNSFDGEGVELGFEIKEADTGKSVKTGWLQNVTVEEGSISGETELNKDDFELWWPNGLGEQHLYNITVIALTADTILASVTRRMGFRTIVLNMEPISPAQLASGITNGSNWHFEVNGHEFYTKGSNFIPPDAFWPRVTESRVRNLFQSVIDGNQNMLRVWATGAYSPDFMYNIADELGILLWSEFEFGDLLYPIDETFLESVTAEATFHVRRVNHHPSLALWAGGNELENLMLSIVNQTAPDNYALYKAQYETLFLDTLLPVVYGNSRSISYTPSSTSNGYKSLNFSSAHPMVERYQDFETGTIHGNTDHYDYNVSHSFDTSTYPVGRFANEFGFHSHPSIHSWLQVLPEDQRHFNSNVVLGRSKHYPQLSLDTTNRTNALRGSAEMTNGVQMYFPTPNKSDATANLSAWSHATQLSQAAFYKSQIEFYRRGSGLPERQLGSLYWQLNDIWQAPSWAGIEYNGRWKVLHYVAKEAYEPVVIAPFYSQTTGALNVFVTSDIWEEVHVSVEMHWYTNTGNPLLPKVDAEWRTEYEVTAGALNTSLVLSIPDIRDLGVDLSACYLSMALRTKARLPNAKSTTSLTHRNTFTAVPFSSFQLVDPGLTLSYDAALRTFTIQATSAPAFRVWLDMNWRTDDEVVIFSDNAFDLNRGERRVVGVRRILPGVEGGTVDESVLERITVQSLWDLTTH